MLILIGSSRNPEIYLSVNFFICILFKHIGVVPIAWDSRNYAYVLL